MPTRLISQEPSLIPGGSFVSEVFDIRVAIICLGASALNPFEGPIVSLPADLGPESYSISAFHASHRAKFAGRCLHIIFIASASGRLGVNCLVILGGISRAHNAAWGKRTGMIALVWIVS